MISKFLILRSALAICGVTCITWLIQAASDASFMGYPVYFFKQAGMATDVAFDFSISLYGVAMADVMISEMNQKHGRRVSGVAPSMLERLMAYDWPVMPKVALE